MRTKMLSHNAWNISEINFYVCWEPFLSPYKFHKWIDSKKVFFPSVSKEMMLYLEAISSFYDFFPLHETNLTWMRWREQKRLIVGIYLCATWRNIAEIFLYNHEKCQSKFICCSINPRGGGRKWNWHFLCDRFLYRINDLKAKKKL